MSLQPLVKIQTDLGSYADIRLAEDHLLISLTIEIEDTHTVWIDVCRIIDGNIVLSLMAVTHRQTVMYFSSQEEVVTAELRTEHHRNADLQHVTRLAQVIKEISVRRAVGTIQTRCLETIRRGGIQKTEVQTCLKQEMSVLQVIRNVQTYSGAAFELLERIALVQRSGAHI